MKITDKPIKDEVVNVKSVQQETSLQLDNRFIMHKGHTLFEINTKTLEVKPAEFEVLPAQFKQPIVDYKGKHILRRFGDIQRNAVSVKKVVKKENCIYVPGLNKENVMRKLGIEKVLSKK